MKLFNTVTTFVFDVDGVMTNGHVHVFDNGEQVRSFYIRDGLAIVKAINAGYKVAVISAGNHGGTRKRLEYLGIQEIHMGVKDKLQVLDELVVKYKLKTENMLYMGDDLPDYHALNLVGFPTCPNDAAPEIIEIAKYVSPYKGGQGAVRDVIEKTMRIQETWSV